MSDDKKLSNGELNEVAGGTGGSSGGCKFVPPYSCPHYTAVNANGGWCDKAHGAHAGCSQYSKNT